MEKRIPQSGEERAGEINTRILRGLDHFTRHASRIVEDSENVYFVPSASGSGSYRVRLDVMDTSGDLRDICPCADYAHRGRDLGLCRHTVAAMVYRAKGGSLGFARATAEAWIEFRVGMRHPEVFVPRNGYVLCMASVSGSGRRYVFEVVAGTGFMESRREDRPSLLAYESAVLVGRFASEDEMREAYELMTEGDEGRAA